MIKSYLKQLSSEKAQRSASKKNLNLINPRIFDQLKFNSCNKLLSLVDAGLQDYQLTFFIQTINIIMTALKDNLVIKGLNFNSNSDLTDSSLRVIIDFMKGTRIKVLSIEKFSASHQGI